jgi:hypothetical protein
MHRDLSGARSRFDYRSNTKDLILGFGPVFTVGTARRAHFQSIALGGLFL